MEPHKSLSGIESYEPDLEAGPQGYFDKARVFVQAFYSDMMSEISGVVFKDVTPEYFFREVTFVIHATGFSAKAVGNFFPKLVSAYGPWNELGKEEFDKSFERIRSVCNNPQKAKAVHKISQLMIENLRDISWPEFKIRFLSSPEKLKNLPYIGKITCFHLARNIGLLDFVKPDLHLIRMAKYWEFKDCIEMCKAVQPMGMPLGIVDLIFWISASHFGTLKIRKEGER